MRPSYRSCAPADLRWHRGHAPGLHNVVGARHLTEVGIEIIFSV
jgi:hypothetical protein